MARQIQRQLEDDQKASGRAHVWGDQAETAWDIPACFNHSDALITDVSSVASDFLASGKPMAMVAIRQPTALAFRREVPMARVAYVIKPDLSTLESTLDDLLGADPLAEEAAGVPDQVPRRCVGPARGRRVPPHRRRDRRRTVTPEFQFLRRISLTMSAASTYDLLAPWNPLSASWNKPRRNPTQRFR